VLVAGGYFFAIDAGNFLVELEDVGQVTGF